VAKDNKRGWQFHKEATDYWKEERTSCMICGSPREQQSAGQSTGTENNSLQSTREGGTGRGSLAAGRVPPSLTGPPAPASRSPKAYSLS
jgi:hypothetical protein